MRSFAVGAAIGVATAAIVAVAAPVAVTALVTAGVSTTVASAIVTTGLGVGAVVGTASTVASTTIAVMNNDWDSVAFNAGNIVGGIGCGSFMGRGMVNKMTGIESRAPTGISLKERLAYEHANRYNPNYENGSVTKWMGSAPTPMAGAAAIGFTAGTASLSTLFKCGE